MARALSLEGNCRQDRADKPSGERGKVKAGQASENCRTNGAAAGVFAADHRQDERETKSGGDTRPTLTIRPGGAIVQARAH